MSAAAVGGGPSLEDQVASLIGSWLWLLGCLGLLGTVLLHQAWTRWGFAPRPRLRETPLWRGIDLVFFLAVYVLLMIPVTSVGGLLGLDDAAGTLIAFVLWNGSVALGIVFFVRRVLGQPLAALGLRGASARHVTLVVLLNALTFVPILLVHGAWLLFLSWLGSEGPRQETVELFRSSVKENRVGAMMSLTASAVVAAPLCEEIIFRGFFFGMLRPRWGFIPAALLSSAVFALLHGTLSVFVPIFVVGVCLAYVYERTGSLYLSILYHGLFNGAHLLLLVVAPT